MHLGRSTCMIISYSEMKHNQHHFNNTTGAWFRSSKFKDSGLQQKMDTFCGKVWKATLRFARFVLRLRVFGDALSHLIVWCHTVQNVCNFQGFWLFCTIKGM